MCSLCGVLAGRGHWTEESAHPEVFAHRDGTRTRTRERQARIALLNRLLTFYNLSVSDWGSRYVLRSHTGRTAIASDLSSLWREAERLSSQPCDPLDSDLLDALESS